MLSRTKSVMVLVLVVGFMLALSVSAYADHSVSAEAGNNQEVITVAVVELDGSGSSCVGCPPWTMSYSWSFESIPTGSSATMVNSTSATPMFTADVEGDYEVSLEVNNGHDYATDYVTITAVTIYLPDTGQTDCYDSYGTISCSGTGQDGEYTISPMGFTNNLDGTLTDNVTGLMWMQDDAGAANWYKASGTYHATYNPASTDVCGDLELPESGYTDWRLPSRTELITIMNYGTGGMDSVFLNQAAMWSSNVSRYDSTYAWLVDMPGSSDIAPKTTNYIHVRCVRGAANQNSFTDNGDGTVTDDITNLMWQKCSAGLAEDEYGGCTAGTAEAKTWYDALSYCDNLEFPQNGFTDWRLPNIKELESITDLNFGSPAIDRSVFPDTINDYYWASTTKVLQPHYGWDIYTRGEVGWLGKLGNSNYVRCVR